MKRASEALLSLEDSLWNIENEIVAEAIKKRAISANHGIRYLRMRDTARQARKALDRS